MTKIEELHLLLELLKKHNLPISPILEYSIKEKEEEYLSDVSSESELIVSEPTQPYNEETHLLDDYVRYFTNLSVGTSKGKKLPHKSILILTIISLIENGKITSNQVPVNNFLSKAFVAEWTKYFPETKIPSVWIPFWYMKSEPFWHLKSNNCDDVLDALLSFAGHPSKGQMEPVIKYAYFDSELYAYILDDESRKALVDTLIRTYIK